MRVALRTWVAMAAVAVAAAIGVSVMLVGGNDEPAVAVDTTAPWSKILAGAQGQTVRLWMWGGEVPLNTYIDEQVVPAAARLGVTLERVPIEDTASAISRLVAEADAGATDGAIDLLWVNGKNFEQGVRAGLWLENWVDALPNASLLDPADPTLWNDFGVPTEGREMPWSRAAFVFAHDTTTIDDPPGTFDELLAFAQANPGRFTYPAPPDFTGSAFVRLAVQTLGEDAAFELLVELEPLLWQGGDNHPVDQAHLDQLFAAGEVDLSMSYNPNFVDVAVRQGSFPDSARPFVFDGGTLSNVSFLAIPARASSPEGAMVVADLMLGAELQAAKAELVGIPSVLGSEHLDVAGAPSPHRLDDHGRPLAELPAERVPEIDRRWLDEVG